LTRTSKLDSLIGLSRRAGCLAVGATATEIAVKKGHAYLVILAEDLACGSKEAMERLCRRHGVQWIYYGDRGHLGHVIGRDERAVLAVTSREFAGAIRRLIQPEE
jgi:ribosomal protein L7Ae-like RNA K-turn-binding protein